MRFFRVFFLALAVLFGGQAFGQKIGINCDYDNGSDQTGCRIQDVTIFSQCEFESDVTVNYVFSCRGNQFDIGLTSDVESKTFLRSSEPQRIIIKANRYLKSWVPNPQKAYASSLSKDCEIVVKGISLVPSASTIDRWQESARLHAQIVKKTILLYQLAKSFDQLQRWSRDHLLIMKDKLEVMKNTSQWNPHLAVLLGVVNSTLDGVNQELPEDFNNAAGNFLEILRNEMTQAADEAESLVDLMDKYRIAYEQLLKASIEKVKCLNQASASGNFGEQCQ